MLKQKPKGFQLWLSKQSIGVCTTQKNTVRIQDILDNCCPNCGKRGEDNKHLNRCELAFWVNEYLLHRGQVRMANLATLRPMTIAFQEVAERQGGIGWDEFLHDEVSKKFWTIQTAHCILAGTNITDDDWMKQFIQ